MTVLHTKRIARVRHTCSRCNHPIAPGTPYVASALTPHDGDIGNETWWHVALHGEQPEACDSATEPAS